MTKIVGLTGYARSGKDTSANFIEELKDKKVLRLCFSKILKDSCKILFNLTDEQLHTDKKEDIIDNWKLNGKEVSTRKLLQWMGTEILRTNIDEDFFIKHMSLQIQKGIEDNYDYILVTDVRFDNEAELIHKLNGKVYQILRPSLVRISLSDHASEKGIHESLIDEKIVNDQGLEEFKEKIHSIFG